MSALRSARGLLTTTSRALAQRSSSSSVLARSAFSSVARARPVDANVWAASGARQFSVSRNVRGEGTTDMALVQKLSEELQYEREAATAQSGTPDFITEFKSQGVWTINDTPSADEVTFERTFGNEHIRIMFSIADLDANPEHEFDPDALEEGEEPPEPQPHTVTSTPIRVAISITKRDAPGALSVDSLCQDGAFLIENASFYQDKEIGTALTAEADWKRRGLYLGPTFENLDAGVQDEFEKYLDERGINESMALFIPDYAEYKEQTEYVRWLESIKKFVEA
ncbi:mitochondrial glyco protein [Fomitiporia mediterranea MF3/22]|uniref:mitochondrial glyco protein n=1 Tax=Fomitiporia mediterranea (strain MF3/22) TaxID=694068 RepID=UPI0004407673|nr:mitochondrial glyco protein [Fomitiporia mediterranea MF3/22]EJC98272.1 mitochondrial glyco protein [Fomitiporia mediterranea MF3/22]